MRSKLVREGVYVAKPKVAAKRDMGPTKKELLKDLEATGFEVAGFEGATKEAIVRLIGTLRELRHSVECWEGQASVCPFFYEQKQRLTVKKLCYNAPVQ